MDEFAAIRAIALRNVLKADSEDFLIRKVFRSYSKTFHTPLYLVESLPLQDVLLAFFEDLFESMEKADLENERLDIIETDEELRARQKAEDADEAEMHLLAVEAINEEKADLGKIKLPSEQSKFKAAIGKLSRDVELINSTLEEVRPEPGIKMIFDDTFDEADLEKDSFGLLD